MIEHPSFAPEPWALRETAFSPDVLAQSESLFALANGYLGLRGNLDEGEPSGVLGTYLNAFHERRPLDFPERGTGWASEGQHLLNVTDGKVIRVKVDGEPLDVRAGVLSAHQRVLDFRTGVLTRTLRWRSESGRQIEMVSRRLVSLTRAELAAVCLEVRPLDGQISLELSSELVGNESSQVNEADPRASDALHGPVLLPVLASASGRRAVLVHATARSRLTVAAGMDHLIEGAPGASALTCEENLARATFVARVHAGQTLRLTKLLAYRWSAESSPEQLDALVNDDLTTAMSAGAFERLASDQRAYLADFWSSADVQVEGDQEIQQALRFGMFHLLQACAQNHEQPIPAKGLTGQGYDGHAFWDTETFVLPVLTYTRPKFARSALRFRIRTLEKAHEEAVHQGLPGVKYPWRTITGDEASGYFPAGEAAIHVNADIARALTRYITATGDYGLLADGACELLVETARFFAGRGYHDERRRAFCIDGVTGPDEYSALVDNNCFTNLAAARNLTDAAWALAELARRNPRAHAEMIARLQVDPAEVESWRRSAAEMYVPYDSTLRIHPQDGDFCRHERWDFDATPPECYPLMLHYPYGTLYRRQVVKQADLVLALHLAGPAFSAEQKRADFEYYEAITVRDSSLSACTQSVVGFEVGHIARAFAYLREAALIDLEDLEHNSADGLHIASLAGAWVAVVAGLGGLRDDDGTLRFAPRPAGELRRVSFSLRYRRSLLQVSIGAETASYRLAEGEVLSFSHWGQRVTLRTDMHVTLPIPPPPQLPAPPSVPGRAPTERPATHPAFSTK